MKRLLAVFFLALVVSACEHPVKRAEFESLVQQHQQLRTSYDLLRLTQLRNWSDGVNSWGAATGDILCEIHTKVTPSSAWSQEFSDYCSNSDPPHHPPDPPPEWGG